ncbi:MAG: VOC family protein [Pseudomonadota bacterium]
MNAPMIEHVNLTVSDSKRAAETLCRLFDWRVRWHGPAIDDGYTYHVGTDDRYLALYSTIHETKEKPGGFAMVGRLNHVGVVVDNLEETEKRVIAAGFKPFNHRDYEPGRRFYFMAEDEIEYEVVSYAE